MKDTLVCGNFLSPTLVVRTYKRWLTSASRSRRSLKLNKDKTIFMDIRYKIYNLLSKFERVAKI